ncbi:hypothetical protein BO78DRAFT_446337 [Aspergillus sclerotiicarbonarius CBS 121057]|uniref:Uncharacterized protein n=1 Tax=Aspergillus sclerotiicarbonarius (strain CBS 121057 / IBT 28362) TaxID=1448318 RepID=A0A319ETJ1_ASPSB|nr:hypothetical protein BO78DRAFT_446337 [Aspergillus sclerotiicarbonarius CBS 121057]
MESTTEVWKTPHLPCYHLNSPPANPDFRGREDILERLANELLPSKNAAPASGAGLRQFALCGFGGIGKTEIAREFSRRHKACFDAVFWVVADKTWKLDDRYQQIAKAVKGWLSNPPKQHLPESNELVQAGPETTWLLIFDNADDPTILADYWPQDTGSGFGSGSILITSRDPLAKSMYPRRPSGLDLGPLSQGDSLALFHHLTTIPNEPEDMTARRICHLLGGIPLVISQMAGIISRQDLTLSEFLQLYTNPEERGNLYKTKFDTNMVRYPHYLATVWDFWTLKFDARQLLEVIALLDSDLIKEDLLMKAAEELNRGTSYHYKTSTYIQARSDLLQCSLIQRDKEKQQISAHRIVRKVTFATMDSAKKDLMLKTVGRVLWPLPPIFQPSKEQEPDLPKPKSSGCGLHAAIFGKKQKK